MHRTLLLSLLVLVANPLLAGEIYRHVDKNGSVVFTDQPPEDTEVEQIQLGPINTVPAARPPRRDEREGSRQVATAQDYQRLELAGITPGDELRNPAGAITLSANPDIPLQAGHSLVFIHNGREIPGDTGSYVINEIERGAHTFSAEIRDASGKVLIRSEPATIQVFRTRAPR